MSRFHLDRLQAFADEMTRGMREKYPPSSDATAVDYYQEIARMVTHDLNHHPVTNDLLREAGVAVCTVAVLEVGREYVVRTVLDDDTTAALLAAALET